MADTRRLSSKARSRGRLGRIVARLAETHSITISRLTSARTHRMAGPRVF